MARRKKETGKTDCRSGNEKTGKYLVESFVRRYSKWQSNLLVEMPRELSIVSR